MSKITLAAAAAISGLIMLLPACGGGSKAPSGISTRAPGGASPGAPPAAQLTQAQARQAFNAFLPSYNKMVSTHNTRAVPQLTTGAEAQVQAFATKNTSGLATPRQVTEKLYVPRLTSYPRWFAAAGGTKDKYGNTGGDLFLMVQSQQGAPWQEAENITWVGDPPSQLSGIAVDSQGYATAVDPSESSLVTSPQQLPGQYAQLLGGAAAPSPSYAAGDSTTGWISTKRAVASAAPAKGWQVSFAYSAPALPVYALRTTDGGALVFFAFDQASTWIVKSASPRFSGGIDPFDGRMPLILAVEAGLSSPHPRVGTRITATQRFETLAAEPSRGGGKVSVLQSEFNGGGVTAAAMG